MLHIWPTFVVLNGVDCSHCIRSVMVSRFFYLNFSDYIHDLKYLFMWLFANHISSLVSCLLRSLAYFLIWLFDFYFFSGSS